jgi:hypothetical protein
MPSQSTTWRKRLSVLQVYYDPYPNKALEKYITDYGEFLKQRGERPVTVKRLESVDEVLEQSDVRHKHLLVHVAVVLSILLCFNTLSRMMTVLRQGTPL